MAPNCPLGLSESLSFLLSLFSSFPYPLFFISFPSFIPFVLSLFFSLSLSVSPSLGVSLSPLSSLQMGKHSEC